MDRGIPQVKRLDSAEAFAARLHELGVSMPMATGDPAAVLGQPLATPAGTLVNRWAILPMEGWDGTADGRPTELVERRWERFARSGAGLIWGGEAYAVRTDGRANPRQLCAGPHAPADLGRLHQIVEAGNPAAVVGLQLTHSGRWSRPEGAPAPRIAYRHPWLDARVGATDEHVVSDAWLDDLVGDMVATAVLALEAGFTFVDVKHCHGYLLHELLSAVDRPGRYGGDLDGRTRFLREVVNGIRRDAPGLRVAVRLSAFDVVPHVAGPDGRGVPVSDEPYRYAFGGDGTGTGVDLTEVHALCALLADLDVSLVCVTAGSPYWCPHVQRPAYFPPSDGYLPPHDPLVDVANLLATAKALHEAHPRLTIVATGLSYLQEWMASVAAGLVADGWASVVGYGRGVLSYPELAAHVLAGHPVERARLCRTFSDCTTAPRAGLVSGCYPLDEHYKAAPERLELTRAKRAAEAARGGRRGR